MAHHSISYAGDNSDRRALLDLVQWLGFRRSILVWRQMRWIKQQSAELQLKALDRLDMELNLLCGVSGHPVRRLFAKFVGEEQLVAWINS